VPTLVTYEALAQDGPSYGLPPESIAKIEDVRRRGMESLTILRNAGVTIAFGTDLLGKTHVRQNEEFAIRACVLPSREIIASATTVAARLIGMEGKLGILTPGALADLIVVDGDPMADAAILADPMRRIQLVMKEGTVVRRSPVALFDPRHFQEAPGAGTGADSAAENARSLLPRPVPVA